MGLVIDVVPNHMGVLGADNAWWMDVLENGQASRFAEFFDIDWQSTDPQLAGRVLVPPGVPVRHPAFDVTPAELVTAIVSEPGIVRPPYAESLAEQLERASERAAG